MYTCMGEANTRPNSCNPYVATADFWADPPKRLFSIQPPTKKAVAGTLVAFQHWLHWNAEKMVSYSYRELHFLAQLI